MMFNEEEKEELKDAARTGVFIALGILGYIIFDALPDIASYIVFAVTMTIIVSFLVVKFVNRNKNK
jgi:predicted PurR-regulated permease PerM